jgi:type I restriction-modification system DNA methylase subunit
MDMKIYAFITPDIPKNADYLKIGETKGSVEKRIKEQGHTHNSRSIEVWRDSIVTEQRRIDKRIHAYLREQGFDNPKYPDTGEYTELIKCSVDDLKKAFEAIKQQVYQEEKQREDVGKKFYLEIRNWFYWASAIAPSPDYTLRIIVRTLLCFFFQEKGLVSRVLFDENWLKENLKADTNRFYNGILCNLFFHCLNTPMKGRTKFAHSQIFKGSSKVKEQLQKIPLLNGGLFNEHEGDNVPLSDGYFFSPPLMLILPELDDKKPYQVEGLINILSKYKYKLTLDDLVGGTEYTKTIDPEFLGKVFESLLACIDADSKETRRKTTGSYYTPSEIVEYIVNEALEAFLETADSGRQTAADASVKQLLSLKILDPACGSGAFSCGVMNEIMRRIDPDKELSQSERYHKKLEILQKVIYGVDIQQMAVQIAVLRLFLSLIQEIIPDKKKDNYGIKPLPNLETKFVCANTLIGLSQSKQGRLELPIVKSVVKQLQETRNQYLVASDPAEKTRLQNFDASLRNTLSVALEDAGSLSHDVGEKLASWNPYNQSISAEFFEPYYMFGVEAFDIVMGNPPWGAKYSDKQKEYFKKHYKSAKTTKDLSGSYKGSLDTFSLFIEKAFNLVAKDGFVMFIVPLSVIAGESSALHKLLLKNCQTISTSSYSDRPRQIFPSGHRPVTIIGFTKTNTSCNTMFTTKLNRWYSDITLQQLLAGLSFVESKKHYLKGRFARIGSEIESKILDKIYAKQNVAIRKLKKQKGKPLFWRNADGGYYSLVLPHTTNSKYECSFFFDKKIVKVIGAALSSNLFFWHQKVYSDNYHLTKSEIESFPLPPLEKLTDTVIAKIEKYYDQYVADIERNVIVRSTKAYSQADSVREYKLMRSRDYADKIDEIISPLYGLTESERDFIKQFEWEYRNYGDNDGKTNSVTDEEEKERHSAQLAGPSD